MLALGNFDGVHRGHRKILDRVCRVALEQGVTPVVMTFDPHPSRVVRPDKAPPLLMTTRQKLDALSTAGLHGAAIVRFTRELSMPRTVVAVQDYATARRFLEAVDASDDAVVVLAGK